MKRQPRIANQIALDLAEAIREGRYRAGQNLPRQKIADTMQVSRQPVVDALMMLHERNIVELRSNRGFFVIEQSPEAILQKVADIEPSSYETYFRIAEDRLNGRLDDEITVTDIQRIYGISRNQGQSILAQMAQEGWITRKPGYGWRFVPMLTSPEAYRQSYEFRLALEPAAVLSKNYRVRTDEFIQFRRRIMDNLKDRTRGLSPAQMFQTGSEFHELIVGCSNNPLFLDALKRINQLRRLIEYHNKLNRGRVIQQSKEHIQLLDLLLDGRRTEAAEYLRRHLEGAREQKLSSV